MRIHINLRVVLPTAPYFIFHIGSIHSHRHAVKRTQLVAAAKNGRMTDVARLIKCGANMEAKDASVRVCRDALTCFFIFELRSLVLLSTVLISVASLGLNNFACSL